MDAWAVLRRRFVTRNFMAGAASRSQRRPRPDRSDLHAEMLENRVLLSAWVVTDKPDYAPGQTAVIDAGGFAVGETVALQVVHHDGAHGDDGAHQPWFVTDGGAGDLDGLADGDIHTSWYVGTGERGASLDLAATGLTSGEVATTHFTDVSPLDSVDVSAQSGTLTYGTGGDATYTVTVNRDLAFVGAFDVVLDVTAGLPSGATFSFEVGGVPTNELNFTASDDSLSATLIVSTANDSPAGSFLFDVSAEVTSGGVPTGDFVTNTGTLVIGKLALTGTITAADKAYDGTTSATIVDRDLTGVVSGDDVQYVGGTASFDTKNVGTGKTVTATGLGLTGADADNYTVNSTAATTADVTVRTLTITATGSDKVYDGTAVATVSLSDDRVAGDIFTDIYTAALFDTKNVGTGKTINVTGIGITGTDAANYTANSTAVATADVTVRSLTVTATGVNKAYDGTTTATVNLSDNRVAGDVLTDNFTTATFDTRNVGTGKAVSVTGIFLTGADAANYAPNTTANTTANITAKALTGTITVADKVYDGTTAATITARDLSGVVPGESVTYTGGTAAFADKNAGIDKTVTASGLSLTGADAGNYTVNSTAISTADITALTLTVTATGVNKAYDGTTAATVILADDRLPGDVFTAFYTSALFDTRNVGTGKPIAVTGIFITGTDAGNYSVNTTAGATADITRKVLTATVTVANKVYDGTRDATITGRELSGVIPGEDVTATGGTATFDTRDVGFSKPVTATGLSLTGADAGNYTVNTATLTSANITAKAITVTADPKSKVAGTADPPLTYQVTSGSLVGGDSFGGALLRFPGENPGFHPILQGSLSAGGNYALTYVGANLLIIDAGHDLTGPWSVGGLLASVTQTGTSLSFTDQNSVTTAGTFIGVSQVTGRGGLTATIDTTTVDFGRLVWSDGVVWLRTSLSGQYYNPANNALTSIAQNGLSLTFTNAAGTITAGALTSPFNAVLPTWGQTATFANGGFNFSGGSSWKKLDLSPDYVNVSGNPLHVTADGTTLTFVNRTGDTTTGFWTGPTQVSAPGWGVTGVVANGRIQWSNNSVWNKNLAVFGTGTGGTGVVSIASTSTTITLTNKTGGTSRGQITSAGTLVALDWGVTGTRGNGKISWSNGTTWDSFDFNALDALFSDIKLFPFGS